MTRRRYRYNPVTKQMDEVSLDALAEPVAPTVWNDLPAYESPIDGRIVDGRRQRRYDLERTGCRPYEGREQESKEAAKVQAANERHLDQVAEKCAHRAWAEAPERVRRVFRGR